MKANLRVLQVYRTYYPDTQGGLEEVIRQICRGTKSLGVESRVFTLSPDPDPAVLEVDGTKVYRARRFFEVASCGVSLSALKGFRELVEWADVIHYHFPWPFEDVLHFAAGVKKPSVVTYHSDIVRQKRWLLAYRGLMRAFLGSVDAIVATSENYFATSAELARYSDKVEVIPIGLDGDSYPKPTDSMLEDMAGRVGKDFFLFVGVLRYYKGLHILLDAVKGTDMQCLIVGSGPIESELKRRVDEEGISNVRFMGHVSDDEKMALMALSRAVVFPSHLRSEAFGVTLLEGAMAGKPLVSTEIGTGTSFVNQDGETGIVVPPGSARHLREAMERLAGDEDLARRMGAAACRRYEAYFTADLMARDYVALYERIIADR